LPQPDRAVREGGIEVGGGREVFFGPVVLVPAAADDPGVGGHGRGIGLQAFDDLRLARRTDEVGAQQGEAEVHQVAVRVDQAGHHHAVAGVVARRRREAGGEVIGTADRDDAARVVPNHRVGAGRLAAGDACRDEQVHGGRRHGRRRIGRWRLVRGAGARGQRERDEDQRTQGESTHGELRPKKAEACRNSVRVAPPAR